jgi:hypothetical protein
MAYYREGRHQTRKKLGIIVLKMKKTRVQEKNGPKEDIYDRVSDLKVLNEDNEEVKDQNESTGLSLLETSNQEISLAKDKNNFSASELIITSGLSEEADKEDLAFPSGDKEEVKDLNESSELMLLETSDQGNSLDKDKGDLSVAELEGTCGLSEVDKEKLTNVRTNLGIIRKSNKIKNPVSAKLDDFLWSN